MSLFVFPAHATSQNFATRINFDSGVISPAIAETSSTLLALYAARRIPGKYVVIKVPQVFLYIF